MNIFKNTEEGVGITSSIKLNLTKLDIYKAHLDELFSAHDDPSKGAYEAVEFDSSTVSATYKWHEADSEEVAKMEKVQKAIQKAKDSPGSKKVVIFTEHDVVLLKKINATIKHQTIE